MAVEALFSIGFGMAFYFIPAIIASGRSHPNTVAISVLTFLAGWTGIGWIAALVWSFTIPSNPVAVARPIQQRLVTPPVDPVAVRIGRLERLAKLKADGALTDREYEHEKRQLLS